ncbi:hypothetical protein L210DRAFT_3508175 [Boletus edulis BED1]|uniref:Ribonuclease H1 N-terminal domain-containing protein n=1 Tax=Boletus edulis BED1 TaxID=1328754 RepID=A0AAD4G8G6_BOLED|nr:hypothetical protein L210DRAFT_3508175 [Boletus edulis BED1]
MTKSALSFPLKSGSVSNDNSALDGLVTLLRSLNLTQSDSETLISVLNERVLALSGPPRMVTSSPASRAGGQADLVAQPREFPVTTTNMPTVSETGSPVTVAQHIQDDEDMDSLDPIIVNTSPLRAPPTYLVIQPDDPSYSDACVAMADGCVLAQYHKTFYNLPPPPNPPPPFYCITRGRYIGVFSGWENASPKVQGVSRAIFTKVDMLELGEDQVHKAIERSETSQA